MRIACWITEATNTHSEYVILIASHWNSGYTDTSRYVTLYVHWLSCYFMSSQSCNLWTVLIVRWQ